jgi:hypothetical protein
MSVVEFMIYRNIFNFCTKTVMLYLYKVNPLKDCNGMFDWVIIRGIVGQTCFMLFMTSVSLLPLALHMIIY